MINWQHLTPDARNQLVAVHLFGWKPEPCSQRFHEIWSEPGIQWQCPACGACAENAEQIKHGPINAYPCYSQNMDEALLVLNQLSCDWVIYCSFDRKIYSCDICMVDNHSVRRNINVLASTPQDAVCIAALRAIGLEVQAEAGR